MNFLSLLSGGVQLLLKLSEWAERRGQIEAGMNKILVRRLQATNKVLHDVKNMRDSLDPTERQRLRDKYKRRRST